MISNVVRIIILAVLGYCLGFALGTAANAGEPKFKVAIIDSGYSFVPFSMSGFKLCKRGHYDFATNTNKVGPDTMGHGAYVTALVDQHAETKNLCYLIYKVFGGKSNYTSVNKALKKALRAGASVVNMSLGMNVKHYALNNTLNIAKTKGVKVFVAAGNDSMNLNQRCDTYPTCFKNKAVTNVGAQDAYGNRAFYSNHGLRVAVWQLGDLGSGLGTSFASPRALGDYIKSLKLDKR